MRKKIKPGKTRPRFTMVKVEITEKELNPDSGNIEVSLDFDLINGIYKVINNYTGNVIENTGFLQGYKGESKWRITSEVNTEKDDHSLCFNCKFKRFKHIIAIDTNLARFQSKIVNQEIWIGLGIAVALIDENENEFLQPLNIPFVTSICPEKPENENWIRVIEIVRKSCKCKDPRKVGIVVDSDLENIPSYNKREKPILGNYYLPKDFELIFASDKVTDNIFNKMINESHKISREIMPKFIESYKQSEENVSKNK